MLNLAIIHSLVHDDIFNFKGIIVSSFVILSMTNLFRIDLPNIDWHTLGKWLIHVAKYRIFIDYGYHLIQDNPCPEKAGQHKLPLPPLVRHINIMSKAYRRLCTVSCMQLWNDQLLIFVTRINIFKAYRRLCTVSCMQLWNDQLVIFVSRINIFKPHEKRFRPGPQISFHNLNLIPMTITYLKIIIMDHAISVHDNTWPYICTGTCESDLHTTG